MISFLFWNLDKNDETVPYVGRLGMTYTVDVFLLAECPEKVSAITTELNGLYGRSYQVVDAPPAKVRVISRLPLSQLEAKYTSISDDMTIWKLEGDRFPFISLAVAHLPAKSGGITDSIQHGWAQVLAREIAEYEDREGCQDTALVGDLNMNPFDPGMVSVLAFHALMTQKLAGQPERTHKGGSYRRFYNPMWGLFGDRTPGPAGTYFWDSSVPNNQHWHILDQVLLRPSLMKSLRNIQILDRDGYHSLLVSKEGGQGICVNLRIGYLGMNLYCFGMNPDARIQELDDWQLVCQLLPPEWQEQARVLGALRRARGFANAAVLLRTLLVHLAGGCSLKETATYVQEAGWCDVSPVALFKRLRSAEQWLRWLADQLWQRHPTPSLPLGYRVRAIDATTVGRPGSQGTDWRVHFSVNLEDLQCDFFEVTDAHGGETFRRIPVAPGDLLLGDRCYGTPPGIAHVAQAGGHVLVRVNHKALPLFDIEGEPFRLAEELRSTTLGQVREWPTMVRNGPRVYQGRLVAVKRDRWSACLERRALRKRAAKKQKTLSRMALFLAGYFFVWTSVPGEALDAAVVLAWYRCRWQIELCFKRMKSILGLGDLPKRREDSCRAWLHGKLLVAFLLERLLDNAEHFSPWGYELGPATQSVA